MTTATSRLHICPFSPDLLRAIIPPAIFDAAQNISFHLIQTFPENGYGYVDLPVMDAEKVKKRLNGSILKGKKIKVEEARPPKRRRNEVDEGQVPEQAPPAVQTTAPIKKAKKDPKVLPGRELPSDRKVKRGWTEVKPEKPKRLTRGKSDRPASKFSENEELLFRTTVPPNRIEKSVKDDKKKKKRSDARIVHEFEKSTIQPSFLRDGGASGAKPTSSYVEGEGWVDEDGQVVEQEAVRTLRQRRLDRNQAGAVSRPKEGKEPVVEGRSSSSGSASASDSESEEEGQPVKTGTTQHGPFESTEDTSSSGTSESESDSGSQISSAHLSSSPGITITTAETPPEDSQPEVHPLEALFKKPSNPASQDIAKPSLEVQTSFSFFEAEDKDDLEEEPAMPGTPFSSQDLRSRDHRSAAPTPDTAYPSRFNSYGSSKSEKLGAEDDEEGNDEAQGRQLRGKVASKGSRSEGPETSDFEKSFWEKRGDNNRAWKQRRRETLKDKRQKENRARKGKGW